MKTHLVFALILSGSMLLAQNVTTSLSQLNQLITGYSFSLTKSNLKVTYLEEGEGNQKGDYFIVPLNSVSGELTYSVGEYEGFYYRWSCSNGASCIYKFYNGNNYQFNDAASFLYLVMGFEKAKKVAYLMEDLMWSIKFPDIPHN